MMNKTKFFLGVLVLTALLTACESGGLLTQPEPDIQIEAQPLVTGEARLSPRDYSVNAAMVNGYLKLTKRIKDVATVSPLTLGSDTLAWAVQYRDGWQVLSGDSRMAPVMASSDEGILNMREESPTTNVITGMLHYIRDIHYGDGAVKDRLWKFLETSKLSSSAKRSPRRIGGEVMTRGMWIEQETNYESTTSSVPHIIQTKWGQGADNFVWDNYNGSYFFSEFNTFTKKIQGMHTKAGCTAVAAGQIIHHFRKNNHRDIEVPTNGYVSGNNTDPVFSDFSTNAWSWMENTYTPSGVKYAALFLAYLGNQMGLSYGLDNTTGSIDDAKAALTDYKLAYNQSDSYNFSLVNSSLNSNRPIYISAWHKDHNSTKHSFIIDSKFESEEIVTTTYWWDNDYEVDYYEYNRLDPWRFEAPYEYDPIEDNDVYYEYVANHSRSVSIAMNWGWYGTCNSNYYLAYHYVAPFSDQYGYYPGMDCEYTPNWRVIIDGDTIYYDKVQKMLYNIHESGN